jgi:sec-independent protein translocase protein TatA
MGLDNPVHTVLLLIVLLLVFGAKRLPEMGRSLGDGLRGFKESLNGDVDHSNSLAAARATERAAMSAPDVVSPTPVLVPVPVPVAVPVRVDVPAPIEDPEPVEDPPRITA